MTRQIKFRGKRVDNGKWVYGFIYQSRRNQLHGNPILEMVIRDSEYNNHKVIPETVGQFTGLHDKNGNEIYEGDRVRFNKKNHIGMKGVVRYANHGSFVVLTPDFKPNRLAQVRFSDIKEVEITGNIHDND